MKAIIKRTILILISSSFLLASPSFGQSNLPESVQKDLLVKQIVRSIKNEKFSETFSLIEKLESFGGDLPLSIKYFKGRAAFETGNMLAAEENISSYLKSARKTDKYYDPSLEIMAKIYENSDKLKSQKQARREMSSLEQLVVRTLPAAAENYHIGDWTDRGFVIHTKGKENQKSGIMGYDGEMIVPLSRIHIRNFEGNIAIYHQRLKANQLSFTQGLIDDNGNKTKPVFRKLSKANKDTLRCATDSQTSGVIMGLGKWLFNLKPDNLGDHPKLHGCEVPEQSNVNIFGFDIPSKGRMNQWVSYFDTDGKRVFGEPRNKGFSAHGRKYKQYFSPIVSADGLTSVEVTQLDRGSKKNVSVIINARTGAVVYPKSEFSRSSEGFYVPRKPLSKRLLTRFPLVDGYYLEDYYTLRHFKTQTKAYLGKTCAISNKYLRVGYLICKHSKENLYGLKNLQGQWVYQPQFKYINHVSKYGVVVKDEAGIGLLSYGGEWIIMPVLRSIREIKPDGRVMIFPPDESPKIIQLKALE